MVLRSVCEFLGVEFTLDVLGYAKDTDYAVPDPARSSAWQTTLSKREVAVIEGRVGEQLVAAGYALSGDPVEHLQGVSLAMETAKNRVGRAEARRQQFGTSLFLASIASKLDPTGRFKTSVRDRMIEVERGGRKRSWRAEDREYSLAEDQDAA